MPTINDLRQQAATIKNATQVGENTATRVGTTFETIADLLEGMGGVTNLSTIDIGSIDTLNTTGDMLVGTPNIYTLTKTIGANTFKVGTLFQFANNGRYDVAQVIVSQFIVDGDGRIDTTSADQEVHIFYRLCKTMNGGSLPTPIGTWTTWTELGGSGGSGVTIDPYPTQNSGNAVSSGGVFERLQDIAPKVDISAIDDIDEYSDMLAGVSPFYVVTKTLSGNVFRIGTLMEFSNQGRYILYQILATDYVLNDDGTLDTTLSENGGLKLIWRMKQFSGNPPAGVTIGVWSAWSYLSGGGVQPDNEDIDLNANDQLQFANKLHDASAFSGLGRVYLRKNIVELNLTDKYFDGFVSDVLVQDVGTSSTPDEICFDTTRKMFVARVGLSWYLDWSSDEDYNPITRDVNWNYDGNFYRWNGEELVQWDKTINQLTQAMVNTANTIYHIQYDYDLNGETITIPENCVLEFEGGSLKNGTLVETNTLRVIDGTFDGVEIDATDCNILELYDSVFKNNKYDGIKVVSTKVIAVNCSFVDIGSESSAIHSGIFAYGDCTGTYIVNCLFKNIIASRNATGVHFGLRDDKVTFGFTIKDCIFDNINGISDDGDGIKVIYGEHGENYDIASSIVNCKFYNCSKRAIKIQSRGVRVENVYIEGGCSYASVDFQSGNAYIDGLIANNVGGRINVYKLTGFNYINNVDYNFRERDDRSDCFIVISSNADDYTSGNSIILSNLKCNKITSESYNNIRIDCQANAANIQYVRLSNIKGLKTGAYNPFIEFFGTCIIDYLEANSLTFPELNIAMISCRSGITIQYADICVSGRIDMNRPLGYSSYTINGLYSTTPRTNVAIYNGKAVFTSPVSSISSLASSRFKEIIAVGDEIYINNTTYRCVGVVSESYPRGEWVLIDDIKEKGLEGIIRVGTTSDRPVGIGASGGKLSPARDIGFEYFDTTLGLPIYAKAIASDGAVTWVKADGTDPDAA